MARRRRRAACTSTRYTSYVYGMTTTCYGMSERPAVIANRFADRLSRAGRERDAPSAGGSPTGSTSGRRRTRPDSLLPKPFAFRRAPRRSPASSRVRGTSLADDPLPGDIVQASWWAPLHLPPAHPALSVRGGLPGTARPPPCPSVWPGPTVEVIRRTPDLVQMTVTDSDGRSCKVDLGVFWQAHSPVLMEIGPVLHPDDAVAGKMDTLFNPLGTT